MRAAASLPQLQGSLLLTDGGLETWLIFEEGLELPCFATFPLLEHEEGRGALLRFLAPFVELARRHRLGFVLEASTWRANPTWGARLGLDLPALAEANRRAVAFVAGIRDREQEPGRPFVLSAPIGPPTDAYRPHRRLTADEAERAHAWQLDVLAETEVDLVKGATMAYADEAIGLVRAAATAGLPVAVSFTVETDGRLPSGQELGEAIAEVDAETSGAAALFMVNCAHPTHVLHALGRRGPWERVLGVRCNASTRSHAELDDADALDAGDPLDFGRRHAEIRRLLPHLTVLGGCCGTDHRHVGHALEAWLAG